MKVVLYLATYIPRRWGLALWCQSGRGMQGAWELPAVASLGLYPGWGTRSQTYWEHIQPWPPLWNAMQWPLPCLESSPVSSPASNHLHPPLPTIMISSRVQASRNNNQEGRLSKENFCFLQHTPILRQRSPRALLFGNGLEKNAFIILSSWDTNISLSSGEADHFKGANSQWPPT